MVLSAEKNKAITLGGITVEPGNRQYIDLPLPPLYTHTSVSMPVHVISGRNAGPILFISAAIHGDEINGIEIIRRLLGIKSLNKLAGTLVAVPVVNLYGFVSQSRYLPDRRDLNRSFPGSERGTMAARLAETFMTEIVDKCTHGIDFHTAAAGRDNLPQIRADLDSCDELLPLAMAFAPPVILDSQTRVGTLRSAVGKKPYLLYEAGEALRFNELAIRAGVNGTMRVMRYLNMLPTTKKATSKYEPTIANDSVWMRAHWVSYRTHSENLKKRLSAVYPVSWSGKPRCRWYMKVRPCFTSLVCPPQNRPPGCSMNFTSSMSSL